jgi:hypothetical protein
MRAFYKRFGDFDRDLGYTYGAAGITVRAEAGLTKGQAENNWLGRLISRLLS